MKYPIVLDTSSIEVGIRMSGVRSHRSLNIRVLKLEHLRPK